MKKPVRDLPPLQVTPAPPIVRLLGPFLNTFIARTKARRQISRGDGWRKRSRESAFSFRRVKRPPPIAAALCTYRFTNFPCRLDVAALSVSESRRTRYTMYVDSLRPKKATRRRRRRNNYRNSAVDYSMARLTVPVVRLRTPVKNGTLAPLPLPVIRQLFLLAANSAGIFIELRAAIVVVRVRFRPDSYA